MCLAVTVNLLEMKDTCFELMINVTRQGNNAKMKLNFKKNCRDCISNFFVEQITIYHDFV